MQSNRHIGACACIALVCCLHHQRVLHLSLQATIHIHTSVRVHDVLEHPAYECDRDSNAMDTVTRRQALLLSLCKNPATAAV